MQPEVIVLCENMKNRIRVIVPYMQPGIIVPYEDMKGVIVPYMQPGIIIPCEDIKNKIGVIMPYKIICPRFN